MVTNLQHPIVEQIEITHCPFTEQVTMSTNRTQLSPAGLRNHSAYLMVTPWKVNRPPPEVMSPPTAGTEAMFLITQLSLVLFFPFSPRHSSTSHTFPERRPAEEFLGQLLTCREERKFYWLYLFLLT
jgi:hypothetical protein